MLIYKKTFTDEALKFVERGKAYDREFVVADVASALATALYEELGGVNAMSLIDVEHLKSAFRTAASSLIDWKKLNQKVEPADYADGAWRMLEREEDIL